MTKHSELSCCLNCGQYCQMYNCTLYSYIHNLNVHQGCNLLYSHVHVCTATYKMYSVVVTDSITRYKMHSKVATDCTPTVQPCAWMYSPVPNVEKGFN